MAVRLGYGSHCTFQLSLEKYAFNHCSGLCSLQLPELTYTARLIEGGGGGGMTRSQELTVTRTVPFGLLDGLHQEGYADAQDMFFCCGRWSMLELRLLTSFVVQGTVAFRWFCAIQATLSVVLEWCIEVMQALFFLCVCIMIPIYLCVYIHCPIWNFPLGIWVSFPFEKASCDSRTSQPAN